MNITDLNFQELQQINGGSAHYDMGHAAGEYVGGLAGTVVKYVLALRSIFL
jgi:hypothetical protein